MAQLMMCPGCKADIPAGVQYCQSCFLTPVPRPAAAEVAPESTAPPSAAGLAEPSACSDPDCLHAGRPPAAGCRHCGLRGPAFATTLRFAWGPVTVPSEQPLVVGREDSPIAGRLGTEYGNVSRRHAEVRSDGTALTVVDLDSMNGTFINDERLPAGRATPLQAGDRVRFAGRLEATVTGETA